VSIETHNHGPLIVASSYWGSAIEAAGKFFASVNAGTIRVLVPRTQRAVIQECRAARYAILSRGPWPDQHLEEAVEVLWEDGSEAPYCWHWSPETFDALPGEPEPGRQWVIALWDLKKNAPHKAMERPCHWRRVPRLPWLEPLGE
jgi:hypothetical protein